ncbi:hypothetical protein Tco_0523468 [Tanacetum coccineum]
MEQGFLSQKGSGGGRGVKEKNQVLNNEAAKDVVVPSATVTPNTGSVLINVTNSPTTDLNNTSSILSGPTSNAKLVTSEPSRKSVNFCTLITAAGNEADVAVPIGVYSSY